MNINDLESLFDSRKFRKQPETLGDARQLRELSILRWFNVICAKCGKTTTPISRGGALLSCELCRWDIPDSTPLRGFEFHKGKQFEGA
jgi:hypothetical protein